MTAESSSTQGLSIDVREEGLRKTRGAGLFINLGTFLIGYVTAVVAGARRGATTERG
jgi:hypothetical protein